MSFLTIAQDEGLLFLCHPRGEKKAQAYLGKHLSTFVGNYVLHSNSKKGSAKPPGSRGFSCTGLSAQFLTLGSRCVGKAVESQLFGLSKVLLIDGTGLLISSHNVVLEASFQEVWNNTYCLSQHDGIIILNQNGDFGVPAVTQQVKNLTTHIHEDAGLIPGLDQ